MSAAFFDLDKTVIAKSSTLAFSRPFYRGGLVNRRAVLIEMSFQLGRKRFAGFALMLAASRAGDHKLAADEMLDSQWAKQLPTRANTLAQRYRNG